MTSLEKTKKLNEIQQRTKLCIEHLDDRINLSNKSYFLIENEIKKINHTIKKCQVEQDTMQSSGFSYQNYIMNFSDKDRDHFENFNKNKFRKNKKNLDKKILKNKKLKTGTRGKTTNKKTVSVEQIINDNSILDEIQNSALNSNETDDQGWCDITYRELDGKIGLKEKIYCFCHYVSYGNMIKCDNPNCKHEWFHFHCVGLKSQPPGRWFCSKKCYDEFINANNKCRKKQK